MEMVYKLSGKKIILEKITQYYHNSPLFLIQDPRVCKPFPCKGQIKNILHLKIKVRDE